MLELIEKINNVTYEEAKEMFDSGNYVKKIDDKVYFYFDYEQMCAANSFNIEYGDLNNNFKRSVRFLNVFDKEVFETLKEEFMEDFKKNLSCTVDDVSLEFIKLKRILNQTTSKFNYLLELKLSGKLNENAIINLTEYFDKAVVFEIEEKTELEKEYEELLEVDKVIEGIKNKNETTIKEVLEIIECEKQNIESFKKMQKFKEYMINKYDLQEV